MFSLETLPLVTVRVPCPTGFSCEPRNDTFNASVPLTGYVLSSSLSRSVSEICDAETFAAMGLEGVYAQFFSPACALNLICPFGRASRSPLLTLARDGFALNPVRSTFHELPLTRKLRASNCPFTCGALSGPVTLALAVSVPYNPSCCCGCPGEGLVSAAINCSISCRSFERSATCNWQRLLTSPFMVSVLRGVRT